MRRVLVALLTLQTAAAIYAGIAHTTVAGNWAIELPLGLQLSISLCNLICGLQGRARHITEMVVGAIAIYATGWFCWASGVFG